MIAPANPGEAELVSKLLDKLDKAIGHSGRRHVFVEAFKYSDRIAILFYLEALTLQRGDSNIGNEAAFQLGEEGKHLEGNVDILLSLLEENEPNKIFRANIIFALGKLGDKRATIPLIAVLQDSHLRVRMSSASSLAILQDKRALAPLLELLNNSKGMEHINLIEVLGDLGEVEAFVPLFELLQQSQLEQDNTKSVEILLSFGRLKDKRAFPILSDYLKNEDSDLRLAAIRALGWLYDPRALPLLKEALQRENFFDEEGNHISRYITDAIHYINA